MQFLVYAVSFIMRLYSEMRLKVKCQNVFSYISM